ncbi:DUF3618 domain-containing protein [Horticoccus luteus]|uniref:DUF3618 domain-containing protein n=1 Tax=Horticoccus luteus TaxID=2862869 RepID=A0A8F9TYL7_9BACT|nr:DUF3618 domain-containing protein [Horticoccus luteus]QYM79922.1 DUF3618 domain-containing protein [Horticoccus luteus]
MNPSPDPSEPEAIRAEIAETRQRMDDTIDALTSRLHGRHLLDEAIGLFRSKNHSGESAMNQKIKDTANTAVNAVVSTVKENPIPALLIGGGLAWLVYNRLHHSSSSPRSDDDDSSPVPYSYFQEGTSGSADYSDFETDESGADAEGKLHAAAGALRAKASGAKDALYEGAAHLRDRATEIGSRVADRSRAIYGKARDGVVHTAEDHPLALGLGCLAAGVAIGLALPTPRRMKELAGPTADRLRTRAREAGRDVLERGKRVAAAASQAVKEEVHAKNDAAFSQPAVTESTAASGDHSVAGASSANAPGNSASA